MEKTKAKTAIAKFIDQLPTTGDNVSLKFNKEDKFSNVDDRIGETLIFELPSGKKVKFIAKLVDPKKCKVWKGNIRMQEYISEENTRDLREKIKIQGQLVPVLARPIKNDPQYTHEIIYGSRRHFVCSLMKQGIKILEADLDDADALLFMDAENSGREDMSPYEMALAYNFWIDNGIFKNQGELATQLGITRSWLNKIMSLARISKEIISAIGGPKALSLKYGLEIIKLISKNSLSEENLIQRTIEMKNKGISSEIILNNLLGNKDIFIKEKRQKNSVLVKTIESYNGSPACKIFRSKNQRLILKFDHQLLNNNFSGFLDEIEVLIKSKLCAHQIS